MRYRLCFSTFSHPAWLNFRSLVAGGALAIGVAMGLSAAAAAQELTAYPLPAAEVVPPAPPFTPLVQGPIVEPVIAAPGLDIPAPEPVAIEGITWLPDWMNPAIWFSPVFWDGSLELGINGQQGNSETFSLQTGFEVSRETEHTNWDIDFSYFKNEANGVETQHNALLWSNWDYKLAHPRWSWFTKVLLSYDEFKDYDLQLALNSGLGYLLIDTSNTQFRGRFGAGASREFDGPNEEWTPEAVFGIDFSQQLTERQKLNVTVDYFPAWEDFADYRVLTDAGWELVLDEAANLSLKIGVIDRYDSTPDTAEDNDLNYSVLLLWTI